MRAIATLFLIGLLATTVAAGDNPAVRAYMDFDPPYYVHCIGPAPYTTFNAYFMLDCIPGGVSGVAFLLSDPMVTCPGSFAPPSFTNLFPGDLMIGNPLVPPGATVASTECLYDDPVAVGYLTLFYLGVGDCCLEILDHWDFPRWVVDCNDPAGVDYYCILSHGTVSQFGCPADFCPPGDPGCICGTPTEEGSWGAIKAMYR